MTREFAVSVNLQSPRIRSQSKINRGHFQEKVSPVGYGMGLTQDSSLGYFSSITFCCWFSPKPLMLSRYRPELKLPPSTLNV